MRFYYCDKPGCVRRFKTDIDYRKHSLEKHHETNPIVPGMLDHRLKKNCNDEPVSAPVPVPVVTKPVVTKPVVTKPVVTKPVVTKPVVTKPVVTKPVVTKPVVEKPVPVPVVTKPVVEKPVVKNR